MRIGNLPIDLPTSFQDIGETALAPLRLALQGAAMSVSPFAEPFLKKLAQGTEFEPRSPDTTVEAAEYDDAIQEIKKYSKGTSISPLRWVLNFIRLIWGSKSREQNLIAAIKQFAAYGHQHESEKYAREALRFVTDLLIKTSKKSQGFFTWIFGLQNKRSLKDPVFQELMQAFKAWMEPFNRLIEHESKPQKYNGLDPNDLVDVFSKRDLELVQHVKSLVAHTSSLFGSARDQLLHCLNPILQKGAEVADNNFQ
jgi:hypothetical protein